MAKSVQGPLAGIRVVEIAGVVLGPYASQMLGDLGADVIKVEPPGGDSMRRVGPRGEEAGMAPLFLGCNRNKRSLALDLKHPDGLGAVLELLGTADVLLHNFRPAAMKRLRLDYPRVRDVNESIVYCATFGYSLDGPYGHRGAYDDSVQAASGLATLQAEAGGEMCYLPTIVADKTTAMMCVQAVLAALLHRERTGEGQAVDVPMFETMAGWVAVEHLWGMSWQPPKGRTGYPRVLSPDRRPYRTADGQYLSVLPYTDSHWRTFCERTGRTDLATDARFMSMENRLRHIDECYRVIAEVLVERPLTEWLALFDQTEVPVVRVNTVEQLASDPHLEATGFWQELTHPSEGTLRMPSPPAEFSASPAAIRRAPPLLGEHSREILLEAGLAGETIDCLLDAGVARQHAAGD